MRYLDRFLVGTLLILVGIGCLWWGSPARTGGYQPMLVMGYAFVVLFAVGFVFVGVGLLGMEDDYPGFLSALVLYFILGALISVLIYVNTDARFSLADAESPSFWMHWVRVMAMWPLELVKMAGLLGY